MHKNLLGGIDDTVTDILYEDKNFAAVIKKCGVLSQSASGSENEESMVTLLSEQLRCPVYPVHRLDREAEGVMIYAKSKYAAGKLCDLVGRGGFEKQYLIIVHGAPSENSGTYEDLLFKDSKKNKSYVVDGERKGVKRAVLDYDTVRSGEIDGEAVSLIRVRLKTGRTHQIRVQFSSRGMPVLGDSRYGSRYKCDMCLFSERIAFVSPFDEKEYVFEAESENEVFKMI